MPFFPPTGGGSLAPAGLPAYEVYAAPGGNNNAPGSQGAPKATIYAAIQAAIAAGGGTVNFNSETPVGGPVVGQGIWLRDDGLTVPGFLNLLGTRIRLAGNGNNGGQYVFERPGAALFTTGTTSDFTKPAIWIAGNYQPLDIDYCKSKVDEINGQAAPARFGWEYTRKNDGSIENINVTNAVRAAGFTTMTLDLSTLQTFTILTASRSGSTVTATLQLPDNMNVTPWLVGSFIKVVTSDATFPSIASAPVTHINNDFAATVKGTTCTVSYTQAGSASGDVPVTGGTIVGHGFAATDRLALTSVNAQFATTCMMRVSSVTNATTIVVRDVYGYGSRSASTTQSNIGTVAKHMRGRSPVGAISLYRSSFFGNINNGGDIPEYGPAVDIGCVSANEIRFRECYFSGGLNWQWQAESTDNVDFDRTKVAVFLDSGPGLAGATASQFWDCQSQDGCVRSYGGFAGGNSLIVNKWLQDTGGHPLPTVNVVEGSALDSFTFDQISLADDTVEAINLCANLDPLRVTIGEVFSQATPPIVSLSSFRGPNNVRTAAWTAPSSPLQSAWELGWQTFWPGGIAAMHPGSNRAMGGTSARFANLFPTLANWNPNPFPTGITVTQDGPAPDGTSTAFKIVATGGYTGVDAVVIGAYPATLSASTGDRIAMGCWMKSSADFSVKMNTFAGGDIVFGTRQFIACAKHINDAGWQWNTDASDLTVGNGQYFLQANIPAGAGTYYIWAPTLFVATAASASAADFWELANTFKHQPLYLAPGMSGTMEGGKFIAHGGRGIATGITKVVGAGSGALTLTGTGTTYEPVYGADGTTILGWVALLQATINP